MPVFTFYSDHVNGFIIINHCVLNVVGRYLPHLLFRVVGLSRYIVSILGTYNWFDIRQKVSPVQASIRCLHYWYLQFPFCLPVSIVSSKVVDFLLKSLTTIGNSYCFNPWHIHQMSKEKNEIISQIGLFFRLCLYSRCVIYFRIS